MTSYTCSLPSSAAVLILRRAKDKTERPDGLAALILGCGDAFHLVPRVLNYFVTADFTAALGIGKLVTSITMTVFYVLMYYIWLGYYREKENRGTAAAIGISLSCGSSCASSRRTAGCRTAAT